ncbi:MAG: PAS domain-containing protein [Ferruginibacter sp.]
MSVSIKNKIYLSFFLLVFLFVVSGICSIITLNNNRKLTAQISTITDPSLKALEDLEDILVESKMYTTNWVFLRSSQEDKDGLKKLHDADYPEIKQRLSLLSVHWDDKTSEDSLNKIFIGFDQLIILEKKIMTSLKTFEDYDDPVIKLEAERLIEDELLPRTSALRNTLAGIVSTGTSVRTIKNNNLQLSAVRLRTMISVFALIIICLGILLSLYMTRIIILPVNKIRHIINNLGKGITQKIDEKTNQNEIGKMIHSVNNLSEKLQATASFAQEVGNRNFGTAFLPLSEEDTLGKALIAMRDNLKQSDERLNEAQHIAHLGSWERDMKTNRLHLSDEMFEILEINPASFDFDFKSIYQLIHPDDLDNFITGGNRYEKDRSPAAYECRIVTAKGVVKNIFIQSKVVIDSNGEVNTTLGIVQDITERKIAAQKIEDVNRELSTLFNSIDEVFFSVDMVSMKVIQISDTCEKLYGYKSADFLANYKLWLEIIHPDDTYIIDNENEIMQSGGQITNEYRIIHKDNTIRWVENKITPTLDKDGRLVRVDGVTSDITERKKAETELRISEERYRQIVETAQEGIWLIDENNYTTFVNKKMAEILEYLPGEMIGKQNYFFMDEEWKKNASVDIIRRKEGQIENLDFKYIAKSGKDVWTNLTTNPVFDESGKYIGALAMATDITQRKIDEKLLKQSEVSLEVKNKQLELKNKELEQFAYVASHDLQEPLRTTSSFVDLLKRQYYGKLDDKADTYLTYIEQSSARMKVLIKDLLEYSRIGRKAELEQVDCNKLVQHVLADLDAAIKETGAKITSAQLPILYAYPTELKLLFQNLVMNAIKFRKKETLPEINISIARINENWQFSIRDHGIGIDDQYKERIFIIFQRLHTRTEYEGSGIGLAHCKKIVELHNGNIWIESALGDGTTFHFTLPKNNN